MVESIKGAKEMARAYMKADIPTYTSGPPGVGKSDLWQQLAKELGIGLIDVRLGSMAPEDFGVPAPDLEKQVAVWLKADFWPDVKRDGPKGILLFDEMSDTSKAMQSCAYKIVLDRHIHNMALPKGWYPCAAGNRREDRAAAQSLSTALANRFAHITIEPDPDAWIEWANKNDINPLLPAFIRTRPALLHSMEGADLRAFPTPRSWARVSKICDADESIRYRLIAGLVGEGAAAEFNGFLKAVDLPDLDDIVKAPKECRIPKDPASKYALSSMLARYAKRDNFAAINAYCKRQDFGRDFWICCVLDATKRDASLTETRAFIDFANANQDLHL